VSYSHLQKEWLERLVVCLKPFQRKGLNIWADPYIKVGDRWRREIDAALQRAGVAVFLVSMEFLASDFIYEEELAPLLEAADQGHVTLVCVPISSSAYDQLPLGEYQWARDPKDPIHLLSEAERNAALVRISYVTNEAASLCAAASAPAPRARKIYVAAVAARPDTPLGSLFGVPTQPPHFLPRSDLQDLKGKLLSGAVQSVGITSASQAGPISKVGVHGRGVLARPCSPLVWLTTLWGFGRSKPRIGTTSKA
jgi:hypothetical protein